MWERTFPILATRVNWNGSCHNWYLKEGQNVDSITGHYTFWMNISRTKIKLSKLSANQNETKKKFGDNPYLKHQCSGITMARSFISQDKLSGMTNSIRLANALCMSSTITAQGIYQCIRVYFLSADTGFENWVFEHATKSLYNQRILWCMARFILGTRPW